jgi:hypothetical protein
LCAAPAKGTDARRSKCLRDQVLAAARAEGERMWTMTLEEDYKDFQVLHEHCGQLLEEPKSLPVQVIDPALDLASDHAATRKILVCSPSCKLI